LSNLQKWGGIAALGHAAAYMVGLILGLILIFPLLNAAPEQYLKFLAENQALVYLWNLITYWGSAITLVVMVLALYERLKGRSPALMQTATVFGLIWAGLIIASGNLMLRNIGVVATLYGNDPAQAATAWTALEAVENGIESGNALVGTLWVLLLSVAALRTGGLTRALNYLGLVLGIAGILTLIPTLAENIVMVFGLGMIVWSAWAGLIMLHRNRVAATQQADTYVPHLGKTSLSNWVASKFGKAAVYARYDLTGCSCPQRALPVWPARRPGVKLRTPHRRSLAAHTG
jgi:hypothetical protein